jgi:hypothetical protein
MKLLYSSSRGVEQLSVLSALENKLLLSCETKIYFLESLAWPNKGVVADGLIKLASATPYSSICNRK